ncbi:hypothetical protein M501DRAFT_1018500 [Patellaria atrata CBS 101060]|uniref:ASX DEUBAD domain-containing protein n=1 Tax=Patellaria atrata CBS 101060 TaxID=1346257 RepID=A0A9P4VMW7_9PEZI|nr:hypothetical protein M501DRAFT_1018500 [Patellaria atrata CBS 101060]
MKSASSSPLSSPPSSPSPPSPETLTTRNMDHTGFSISEMAAAIKASREDAEKVAHERASMPPPLPPPSSSLWPRGSQPTAYSAEASASTSAFGGGSKRSRSPDLQDPNPAWSWGTSPPGPRRRRRRVRSPSPEHGGFRPSTRVMASPISKLGRASVLALLDEKDAWYRLDQTQKQELIDALIGELGQDESFHVLRDVYYEHVREGDKDVGEDVSPVPESELLATMTEEEQVEWALQMSLKQDEDHPVPNHDAPARPRGDILRNQNPLSSLLATNAALRSDAYQYQEDLRNGRERPIYCAEAASAMEQRRNDTLEPFKEDSLERFWGQKLLGPFNQESPESEWKGMIREGFINVEDHFEYKRRFGDITVEKMVRAEEVRGDGYMIFTVRESGPELELHGPNPVILGENEPITGPSALEAAILKEDGRILDPEEGDPWKSMHKYNCRVLAHLFCSLASIRRRYRRHMASKQENIGEEGEFGLH